ncbi:MAG TPA: alpha/beta hydrolase-fold protein [Gaiellaceae bacterium]|nr:alpha/beta hydrolase-fold protein [Gaiellaceae bacterium]
MVRGLRRAGIAAVVALVLVTGATGSSVPLRGTLLERSFGSRALKDSVGFDIYLPPGYSSTRTRYPVVYFLHGLPASASAFRGTGIIAKAIDAARRPAILVGPQGARDGDSDPEYLNWGTGRNWETALGTELPHYVDAHFRTIGGRRGRALVGLSAGGYGAVLLALHRLDAFSVIESWSGYFHPTDPSGLHALDLGSATANRDASAHTFVRSLRRAFTRRPTFFGFYVGQQDDRFRDENVQLHRELAAARVPHVFELYRGGHEQALWNRHAPAWLRLALDHLSRAR